MLENVYEGLNTHSEVYFSKEYFCEMYPTCMSSKLCEFIHIILNWKTAKDWHRSIIKQLWICLHGCCHYLPTCLQFVPTHSMINYFCELSLTTASIFSRLGRSLGFELGWHKVSRPVLQIASCYYGYFENKTI